MLPAIQHSLNSLYNQSDTLTATIITEEESHQPFHEHKVKLNKRLIYFCAKGSDLLRSVSKWKQAVAN